MQWRWADIYTFKTIHHQDVFRQIFHVTASACENECREVYTASTKLTMSQKWRRSGWAWRHSVELWCQVTVWWQFPSRRLDCRSGFHRAKSRCVLPHCFVRQPPPASRVSPPTSLIHSLPTLHSATDLLCYQLLSLARWRHWVDHSHINICCRQQCRTGASVRW